MKQLYTVDLTGTKMSQFRKVADQIKEGTVLSIFRRPDNAYDAQAMSVHFGPDVTAPQVGWIPAKQYEDKIVKGILFELSKYHPLEAVVLKVSVESSRLQVAVCLQDEDTDNFVNVLGSASEY